VDDPRTPLSESGSTLHFFTETLGWRFLFALFLSVALWARLTLEQNPERRDNYPTDIQVEAQGLSPGLVVANDVQPVRLRISAPAQSWRTLEPGSFRASVDLTGVPPGLVQRDVKVEVSDPDVKILEVIPSKVSVRVEELRTATVPVRVNQLGTPPTGYRVAGDPVVTPNTVQVSGPSSAVERVNEAAVTVRLDEVKSTVDLTQKPEPRGPGGVVTGVRLEPQLVLVTVRVEQIAGSKSVSVVPQVQGQPATGYWTGRISVEPPTVQIVGDPALLEQTPSINTAPVDVSGAEADVVRVVPLQRPDGITIMGEQTATVRVGVQAIPGQQVRDVAVAVQNVPEGRTAVAVPGVVQVTVSGPQPVLSRLQATDVVASANADGLGEGTQSVPVEVRVPDGVRVDRVSPDRVNVTLAASAPAQTAQTAPPPPAPAPATATAAPPAPTQAPAATATRVAPVVASPAAATPGAAGTATAAASPAAVTPGAAVTPEPPAAAAAAATAPPTP
jgi:YbbR domain-containing protein